MPNREAFPAEVRELLDSGYWRISIRPEAFNGQRIPFNELGPTLQQAQVRLRGWYFPHLSNRGAEIGRGNNFISTWSNFSNYEYWRFYESAQLIHYHGVREVVDESYKATMEKMNRRVLDFAGRDATEIRGYFDIINFLYTITEVFEFSARLGKLLQIESSIAIDISLENISGYVLGVSEPNRAWHQLYRSNVASLSNSWMLSPEQMNVEPETTSLVAVEWFFNRFGWAEVNLREFRNVQQAFLRH